MKLYQNVRESFVEDELDRMGESLGCCLFELCRNDVAAYALNHVPSRYVVTKSGGIISKADSLRTQHLTDVRTALLQAAQVIKENPRHDGP